MGTTAEPKKTTAKAAGNGKTAPAKKGAAVPEVQTNVIGLDTSVLMHDPQCVFEFHEHDVFIPFQVLHELDKNKKGTEEPAMNARRASRLLRDIISDGKRSPKDKEFLTKGFPLEGPSNGRATGRLFIQGKQAKDIVTGLSNGHEGDDFILSAIRYAEEEVFPGRKVIFVTKDSIAMVKAMALGIPAEDYRNDEVRVTEDSSLIRTGVFRLPDDFWDRNALETSENGHFRVRGDLHQSVLTNEFVLSGPSQNHIPKSASVVGIEDGSVILKAVPDFMQRHRPRVYGIKPKNEEQNLALGMLLDPEIDLVTILGRAGSGKTLLVVAAALHQVLVDKTYNGIIFTRANVPMGRDSGFLPGTEREKQLPLMGGLLDNLEVIVYEKMRDMSGKKNGTVASSDITPGDILNKYIAIKDMSLMRGRSFTRKIVIFDEAQNMTRKQVKSALTRVGEGSKAICLGNLAQIDTPYLTEASSGLTYLANQFASWPHAGHIILEKCTRSRLAYQAEEVL